MGEEVAEQIVGGATGLVFRTTMKNNSNNGIDLISVDPNTNTKTIWIVEVKSSINATFPNVNSQNLVTRSNNWIRDISNNNLNGQTLPAAEVAFAKDIQQKLSNGWTLKPMYSTVAIPKPNTTGVATVTIEPVL